MLDAYVLSSPIWYAFSKKGADKKDKKPRLCYIGRVYKGERKNVFVDLLTLYKKCGMFLLGAIPTHALSFFSCCSRSLTSVRVLLFSLYTWFVGSKKHFGFERAFNNHTLPKGEEFYTDALTEAKIFKIFGSFLEIQNKAIPYTFILLDIIEKKSHPNIRREIKVRKEKMLEILWSSESKDDFYNKIDEVSHRDFLFYTLFWFPHKFTEGLDEWQVALPRKLQQLKETDGINTPNTLVLTGSRGFGKTTEGNIFVSNLLTQEVRRVISLISADWDTAFRLWDNNIRLFLNMYDRFQPLPTNLGFRFDPKVKTLFCSRFFPLLGSSESEDSSGDGLDDVLAFRRKISKRVQMSWNMTNGVSLLGHSINVSSRGIVVGELRGDCFIYDDIENEVILKSLIKINAIRKVIKTNSSAFTGMKNKPVFSLISGNYLSREGNIQWLRDNAEINPKETMRFRFSAVNADETTEMSEWTSNTVRYTDEEIQELLKKQVANPYEICDLPDIKGDSSFDMNKLNLISEKDLEFTDLKTVLVLDPSLGEQKSCPMGLTTVLINEKGQFFFSGERFKDPIQEVCDLLGKRCFDNNVSYLFCEGGSMQEVVGMLFIQKFALQFPTLKTIVETYNLKDKSKMDRVIYAKDEVQKKENKYFFITEKCADLFEDMAKFIDPKLKKVDRNNKQILAGLDVLDSFSSAVILAERYPKIFSHLRMAGHNPHSQYQQSAVFELF